MEFQRLKCVKLTKFWRENDSRADKIESFENPVPTYENAEKWQIKIQILTKVQRKIVWKRHQGYQNGKLTRQELMYRILVEYQSCKQYNKRKALLWYDWQLYGFYSPAT